MSDDQGMTLYTFRIAGQVISGKSPLEPKAIADLDGCITLFQPLVFNRVMMQAPGPNSAVQLVHQYDEDMHFPFNRPIRLNLRNVNFWRALDAPEDHTLVALYNESVKTLRMNQLGLVKPGPQASPPTST